MHIDMFMKADSPPNVQPVRTFDGFALVRLDHEGVALTLYVDTPEQAQAIADGFNRAFPKPLAEAAE